jgi:uncharacterized protein
LLCNDAGLSALDRQLADVYAQALSVSDDKTTLRGTQRGWIKDRDDCWKSNDANACVHAAYETRIVELRIQNGLVTIPKAIEYACNDNAKPFAATFYTEDEPRAAVLTYGNDQAIAIAAPGSEAHYVADGVEFRDNNGEATVDFFGTKLRCRVRP